MEILKNQIKNNRLLNAYIFESQNPQYTLEMAKDFAGEIFKLKGVNSNLENNPDLIVIDKKDEQIKLDDVREVIKGIYLRPNNGKVKVYIFNNSQNLRLESSNALLKSIEEPSSYSYIIFTTTNSYSLLPTIRSRCQIIKLNKKRDDSKIDQEKLDLILTNLIEGRLDYYYKNKDFFEKYKDDKEDLFDSVALYFKKILEYKYLGKSFIDKKDYYNLEKAKFLSFDQIEDFINKTEKIKSGFKINANYDLSIEKLAFYIYRKAR